MTERLSDVENRIHTVDQLSTVISAMRGIAAVRAHEARAHLPAIQAYSDTIAQAIGRALHMQPDSGPGMAADRWRDQDGRRAVIALCAEQGFAGSFSRHVLEAAFAEGPAPAALLLIGDRGLLVADELGRDVWWSAPMITHADQAGALAARIAETVFRGIGHEGFSRVDLVYSEPDNETIAGVSVRRRQLVPFNFGRFPPLSHGQSPLLTLPPARLLAQLAEEYVFAELCETAIQSFTAENEARMRAMIAAHTNVEETLGELVQHARQLRQEEITSEVIELAAASLA